MAAMFPSDKNLHAAVPSGLLSPVQQAAAANNVTVDEFVADAIERRLNRHALEDLLAFGKRHARERGLTSGDVARAIAAERLETRAVSP
jgi:hypothetical protein